MASTSNEHQLQLACQTFEKDPQLSIRKTVRLYNILRITLFDRINSRLIHIDIIVNLRKLIVLKEEVIIQKVFNFDSRRFPLQIYDMEDMINRLLTIYDTTYIELH